MPLTKSSAARKNVRLPATLASLNSGHNSNLRTYCVGVRSSSRPNLVLVRPLRPRSVVWWSSLVANLSSTTSGRALVVEVEARKIAGHCRVAITTLTCSFTWPSNNFVLSRYTRSFLVSPSLASKLVRHRLSLHSSCLGASARVSIA